MKITSKHNIETKEVFAEGALGVSMQILIGEEQGSSEIIIRNFTIAPNGYSLHHKHDYEHLVQISRGEGIFVDNDGTEHKVTPGHNIFIGKNEMHQFQNRSNADFEFTCTVLNQKHNSTS